MGTNMFGDRDGKNENILLKTTMPYPVLKVPRMMKQLSTAGFCFHIREGFQVKKLRKLATRPEKIYGKLGKVWGDPHLLNPQNFLLTPCLKKLSGTLGYFVDFSD